MSDERAQAIKEAWEHILKLKKWEDERPQRERELEEIKARTALLQKQNKLFEKCFSRLDESILTLELPSEIRLRLADWESVGKVMFHLIYSDDARKVLEDKIGREESAPVKSTLISKGYLQPEDFLVDMQFLRRAYSRLE